MENGSFQARSPLRRVAAVQLGAAHHAVLAQQPHQAGYPAPGPRHHAGLQRYHQKWDIGISLCNAHSNEYMYCIYIYMCIYVCVYGGMEIKIEIKICTEIEMYSEIEIVREIDR